MEKTVPVVLFVSALIFSPIICNGFDRAGDLAARTQNLVFEPNARLRELSTFTDDNDTIARTFLSSAHRRAAYRIAEWMKDAGLRVWIDVVGNVHGRADWGPPNTPTIFLGSHYDTVLDAGKYDGTLGIIAAISAVKYLGNGPQLNTHQKTNFTWRNPVEIIAFADEEGVRFQSTFLGSKALTGGLFRNGMLHVRDAEGLSLIELLTDNGLDEDCSLAKELVISREQFKAYVEIHSEQGPKLNTLGSPLGVVSGIAGQTRLQVSVIGDQNHAGTVPMSMRKDAVAGAAEAIYKIEQTCKDMDIENVIEHLGNARQGRLIKDPCLESSTCPVSQANQSVVFSSKGTKQRGMLVCTVGQISVWPGASNVIPGSASFTVDLRSGSDDDRHLALFEIYREIGLICAKRGLQCSVEKRHDEDSVDCDPDITSKLAKSAEEAIEVVGDTILDMKEMLYDYDFVCQNSQGGDCRNWNRAERVPSLVSGAGHDALVMNEIGPVGMVFVRDNGISHSPREHVDELDVAAATVTIVKYLEKEMGS